MRARTLTMVVAGATALLAACTTAGDPSISPSTDVATTASVPASADSDTSVADVSAADTSDSGAAAVPSPMSDSADPSSVFATVRAELLDLQADSGTAAALDRLDRRIDEIPTLAGVCHAIAHELGHDAVERAGGKARAALRQGNEVCGGGFIHGVIETALGSSQHPKRDLLRICAPANSGSCFHGVGHGLMFATGMDVSAALALCDRSPSVDLSNRCGEGVFMQLFSSDLSAQHVAGEDSLRIASEPELAQARCRKTRAAYAANCWFYAPTVYLTVHPDDFVGAIAWCREAGTSLGRQLCARGVGSRSVKYHPDDLTVAAATCRTAGRMTDSCLQGMGSYWSVHHRGEVEPADVCRQLEPSPLRKRCRAVV